MAGTTVSIRQEYADNSEVDRMRVIQSLFVDDLELLRARINAICGKLDADAGVTDTNYTAGTYGTTSTIASAAVLTGYKITTIDG